MMIVAIMMKRKSGNTYISGSDIEGFIVTIKKDYYSTKQAAELLGVAVSTIQQWTNSGQLRAWTTAGGHRRIACKYVDEMIVQQQAASKDINDDQLISVVVVEDSAQQLLLYKKHFKAWRMKASMVTAADGYEGLISIGKTLPDVIITDLLMPNMDGFQMIKAVKKIPELKHSLIVVISGLAEDEIEKNGGIPEGVHFFTKPIQFEQLESLIRQNEHINAA